MIILLLISSAFIVYTYLGYPLVLLLLGMIRGCGVEDALNILKFTPNRGAGMVSKVLRSAISNADEEIGRAHV